MITGTVPVKVPEKLSELELDAGGKRIDNLGLGDTPDDVMRRSEKTGSYEVYGLLAVGLAADRPAPGIVDRLYFSTDILVLERDTGVAWGEVVRGEAAIRLAQLAERAHTSLTGIGAADHHARYTDAEAQAIANALIAIHAAIAAAHHVKTTDAAEIVSGTFPVARGGTGLNTITLGGILYASALDVLSRLAPTAANQVLRSTAANVLQFAVLLAADIPNLDAGKITSGQFPLARMPRAASGQFLEGNGLAAAPIFNALVAANIPNLDAAKITSGRFPVGRLPAVTDEYYLVGTGTDMEERAVPAVGGDMLKSTYDIDEDGIVDNSEKLEGSTKAQVQDHTPKAHTLASHSTKAHAELTGVTANQHHTKYTDAEVTAIIAAKLKAGSVTDTTDAGGLISVTFAEAFASTPVVIVQLEGDVDYYSVITAKDAAGFTVKILKTAHLHAQGNTGAEAAHTHGVSFTSGSGSSHRHSNPSTSSVSAGTPSGSISSKSAGTPSGTIGQEPYPRHTHGISLTSGAGSAHKHANPLNTGYGGSHYHTIGVTGGPSATYTFAHLFTYQTKYAASTSGGSPTFTFLAMTGKSISSAPTSTHTHTNPNTSTTGSHQHSLGNTDYESSHNHSVSGTSGAGSSHNHPFTGSALPTHNHTFTGSALGTHSHTQGSSGYESSHTHSVSGTSGAGSSHSHTNPNTSEVNAGNLLATTEVTFSYIAMLP